MHPDAHEDTNQHADPQSGHRTWKREKKNPSRLHEETKGILPLQEYMVNRGITSTGANKKADTNEKW
jgi:hypothetical protein